MLYDARMSAIVGMPKRSRTNWVLKVDFDSGNLGGLQARQRRGVVEGLGIVLVAGTYSTG